MRTAVFVYLFFVYPTATGTKFFTLLINCFLSSLLFSIDFALAIVNLISKMFSVSVNSKILLLNLSILGNSKFALVVFNSVSVFFSSSTFSSLLPKPSKATFLGVFSLEVFSCVSVSKSESADSKLNSFT